MISAEGRRRISEAQKARHAKETKPLPTSTHQWLADEYVSNAGGMALKWIYCPHCDTRQQVREV